MSNLNILQNLSKTGYVYWEPFPYLVIHNALPDILYQELSSSYPSNETIIGDNIVKNNTRYQLNIQNTIGNPHVSPIWQDFAEYHTSQEFYTNVLHIFRPILEKYYFHLGNLYDRVVIKRQKGVKSFSKNKISLDCQIGINSPVTEESSVIGPHLDNPVELYAGLFYLRHQEDYSGGNLVIYKQKNSNKRYKPKTQIPENEIENHDIISYGINKFVLMMCTSHSIHGVTPRSITTYNRRLVNIIAESSEDLSVVV